MAVRIVDAAFDPQAELAGLGAGRRDAGALASFVGYCRDATGGTAVDGLHIEHYPGFTEREIERLVKDVARRFELKDLLVVHRVGDIRPGEAIVLVGAVSSHRAQAFDAVRLMMDYLKTDAPLWKKESGPGGTRWVEPHAEDHLRRAHAGEKA